MHPWRACLTLASTSGYENGMRRLHLGGKIRVAGWEMMNVVPSPEVDHVGDARDLSRFAEASFDELYASHLIEHFDYRDELAQTLREWWRVLIPGGFLRISVPDMEVLAHLLLEIPKDRQAERFALTRMLFGGHVDAWDYHKVGFTQDMLAWFLLATGYADVSRVADFGLFDDTSSMRFLGVPISLNMVAVKPLPANDVPRVDLARISCICGNGRRFLDCHGHARTQPG